MLSPFLLPHFSASAQSFCERKSYKRDEERHIAKDSFRLQTAITSKGMSLFFVLLFTFIVFLSEMWLSGFVVEGPFPTTIFLKICAIGVTTLGFPFSPFSTIY